MPLAVADMSRAAGGEARSAKVVCFGDSITKRDYPEMMGQILGVETIKAGVAGNSTAQALRRMSRDVLAQHPDVVVIFFGTNDLRVDAPKVHVPIEEYAANLVMMIQACTRQGAHVVLCTLPPIDQDVYFTRHEKEPYDAAGGLSKLIEEYRAAALRVAAKRKIPVVDLNQLMLHDPALFASDGVHPSRQGSAFIARHVAMAVGPLLERNTPDEGQGEGKSSRVSTERFVDTPETFDARMAWWRAAKFGMFIHWGVYSQAGGEWNGETHHAEWLQLTAKIPLAEYTAYARTFNPFQFDADEWVTIAKDAGMKYLVITSKHHDGFAMFDSPSNDHNIVKGSAFRRDPIKELAEACREQGIRFGVYYSLGRDWEDPDVPTGSGEKAGWRSNLVDFPDEGQKNFSRYFERKVKPQVRELLTQYGPIGVMWFDTYGLISTDQSEELLQMVRTLQPDCIVNNRVGRNLGDYVVAEQKIPSSASAKPWESCMTMNGKWSYNKADQNWKSSEMLLRNLIDIVSKGGNYLLNVGPTGEGIIPEPSVERLSEMGAWLDVHGEAIYGCGPTPFGSEVGGYSDTEKDKSGQPRFIPAWKWRATTQPGKIYIHVFEWPTGAMEIPPVKGTITRAYLLADPAQTELKVVQTEAGVSVSFPGEATSKIASVLCLDLARN